MSLQDFVRASLDSALDTFGRTSVTIAGVEYPAVFDDASGTEELADAGFEPGDAAVVTISRTHLDAAPVLGTTVTVADESWRVYQVRRLGRAAFTLYLTNPDSSR